eukprot:gene15009-16558_t
MALLYARRPRLCNFYAVVSLVFATSIVCFLFALHSLRTHDADTVALIADEADESIATTDEPDILIGLDPNMFYIDKSSYRIAVAYENPDHGYRNEEGSVQSDESEDNTSAKLPEQTQTRLRKPLLGLENEADIAATVNKSSPFSRYDDESIDQNPVDEKYKDEINGGKVSKLECNPEAPLINIVLLKTHRTGSTSIGNILYRYGDFRNLTFVLPTSASFQYFWPLRFHPSHTRLDLLNKVKPNMAVNIGRYSSMRYILPMMPNDTVVMTILRDPVRHFESVYEYADISTLIGLWNSSRDPFAKFLEAPRNNVIEFVKDSKKFSIELNLLKNGLSFDLGLEHGSYSNDEEIEHFIAKLSKDLDFVLISEYIDESLVLLKRLLCWSLYDIIYIRHKVRNDRFRNNITEQQKEIITSWNRADVRLYQHFNKSLWDRIERQGTEFRDDLDNFRAVLTQVTQACFQDNTRTKYFEIPVTLKDSVNPDVRELCQKLMRKDREYIKLLKEKQRNAILRDNEALFLQRFYREANDSRIYYAYENSIFENRTSLR